MDSLTARRRKRRSRKRRGRRRRRMRGMSYPSLQVGEDGVRIQWDWHIVISPGYGIRLWAIVNPCTFGHMT